MVEGHVRNAAARRKCGFVDLFLCDQIGKPRRNEKFGLAKNPGGSAGGSRPGPVQSERLSFDRGFRFRGTQRIRARAQLHKDPEAVEARCCRQKSPVTTARGPGVNLKANYFYE